MTEIYKLMIAGPQEAVGMLEVRSPYDNSLLATAEVSGAAHIEAALETAHSVFLNRKSWLGVEQRVKILSKTAEIMTSQCAALAAGAAAEGGKPMMDSLVEANRAIAGVKMCAESIVNEAGEVVPLSEPQANISRMAFTQKEPIGVVVAISAFNHPLNLIVHQVAAAIAAGCPVIVKPATATPLSCLRFVKILREAGLPEAFCQVALPENTDLTGALVSDRRVAFFSFIGSAKVGWMLRSKLAPGTRCALEHGGVAPVIIDKTADLSKVIPSVLKGGFYHAGQVCVSVQRIFVPETLAQILCDQLVDGANKLNVGDPLDNKVEVGPLILPAEIERIDGWVQSAVSAGAQLLCGGEILNNNCYKPTVLLNPPKDTEVSVKEIFGPVICVYSYSNVNDAIEQANSLDVAFQAAIFAQDIDRAVAIYHQLSASAVMVNDHTAFRQDNMPFAGLRHSGLGVGGIPHTIADMQIDKMMVIKADKFIAN